MNHKNNGLTLLEVLVVVTVLSVLALSLYTVFKSSVDAWSKSEAHLEIYQNARVVLDQISRELPGAFVGGDAEFKGDDDNPDELEFVTNFAGSIYMIKYELEADNNILERKYDKNPTDYTDPNYTTIEFGFMVSDIDFDYWDTSESEWTGDGDWEETDKLPGAVKINIVLQDLEENTFPFETTIYLPGQ